jgi:hypothetical protein
MNIFVLDENPKTAAEYMCDKHVVKMIVESCQLLSTAHHILDGKKIERTNKIGRKFTTWEKSGNYLRCTMANHPCTIWTRESSSNYNWLWLHTKSLMEEYTYRYEKTHVYENELLGLLQVCPTSIRSGRLTHFAQAMPDEFKNQDPVVAYRNYYLGAKARFAKWRKGNIPSWWLTSKEVLV